MDKKTIFAILGFSYATGFVLGFAWSLDRARKTRIEEALSRSQRMRDQLRLIDLD